MDRLLYATPTGHHPTIGYCKTIRDIELGCKTFARGVEDFCFATGPVQMARSFISKAAIDGRCYIDHDHRIAGGKLCLMEPYDYLVMHDDDLMIDPTARVGNVLDVWHGLMERNPEIGMMGAVYLRERPQIPTVTMPHPGHPEEICHIVCGFGDAPLEVASVGTGFVMIRVKAMRELLDDKPMFRFSYRKTEWGTTSEMGEDYDFCTRMRGKGWKVIADPRFSTVHLKQGAHLRFGLEAWETSWADSSPNVRQQSEALRASCSPLMTLREINGCICIDHIPQLIADANDGTATKAA